MLGYLSGSIAPAAWHAMHSSGAPQMMIMGNEPVSETQWGHAGVQHRHLQRNAISNQDLTGFLILFEGFNTDRAWGVICPETEDAINLGFPHSLQTGREALRSRGLIS